MSSAEFGDLVAKQINDWAPAIKAADLQDMTARIAFDVAVGQVAVAVPTECRDKFPTLTAPRW